MAAPLHNTPGGIIPRPATLVVINPSGNRNRMPIAQLPFTIGRQSDNHLVLRDNRASRNHARILADNGEYYIEDLRSSHGVFINGVRVNRQKLYAADRIEFGFPDSYSLIFTFDDDEIQKLLDQFSAPKTASAGAGNLAKLRALVEVARALQNSLSTDDVLSAVVDAALAITGFERGFLLLNDQSELRVQLARDRHGNQVKKEEIGAPLESIQKALHQRRELLSMTFDPNTADFTSTVSDDDDSRSVVGVPLVRVRAGSNQETCIITSRSDTIGLIYLDSRQTAVDLSSGNRELLQTLALEASTILENARLLEEERIKHRMEEELSIAREIQTSLLPRKLPSEGWFRVAGSSIPSHEVGGDCFDVRQISSGVWSLVVTDVSGKGVSSALLAALLQGSFLLASDQELDIQQMMSRINLFLNERTEGEKYATVFYCTVNREGLVRWANAGHCTPLLVRASGEIETLETTGMPLGMLDEATYEVRSVQLHPLDKIVAYSDGLSDAENAHGKFFEASRMMEIIRAHARDSASDLLGALMRAVETFTGGAMQHDDITAVVVEYRP
ncbi:MAG TPA: SpoIIE family protein phosphatase [Bryobacteraceae bacterium]|nr:SpoIIE family protein phosphatase [Bryobacteraceae bacterium]